MVAYLSNVADNSNMMNLIKLYVCSYT